MKSHHQPLTGALNRRNFIKTTSLATGAVVFGVPTLLRAQNLNSKLNIAVHRRAAAKAKATRIAATRENIVALCDVDTGTLRRAP